MKDFMIRANIRENGIRIRIQYYGIDGDYMTNQDLREAYQLDGQLIVELESIAHSKYFGKFGASKIEAHLRKILKNKNAIIVFQSTGRAPHSVRKRIELGYLS